MKITSAILTISDRSSRGKRADESGPLIADLIKALNIDLANYQIVPDEKGIIKSHLFHIIENIKVDLILTTGGTGLSPRDVTPEAVKEIIDKEVPGIPEIIRSETKKITPLSALSRMVAGIKKQTLIITLPGSPKAVKESFSVIAPLLHHAIEMLKGYNH